MFQIVTGMYFRPVALTETLHQQVFYANLRALRAQRLEFVFDNCRSRLARTGILP